MWGSFSHVQVAIEYKPMTGSYSLQYAKLLRNLARYNELQGRYNTSYTRFSQLLDIYETELGKEHPDTLTSMNNLDGPLGSQGKYNEAEPIYPQTLALAEKVLGKEHPDTLASMNNLAGLRWVSCTLYFS